MSTRETPDRLISAWLELEAPAAVPDVLRTDIHRATVGIRPRPAWLARLRGSPMNVTTSGAATPRKARLVPVLIAFLLVLALAAGAVFVGSMFNKTPTVIPNPSAGTASATPTAPAATLIMQPRSDARIELPFRPTEIAPGDTATWVSVGGEDSEEFARAIYRIDHGTTSATSVVSAIGAAVDSPVSILETGGFLWAVEAASDRLIQFDRDSGTRVKVSPLGPFPIQPHAAFGSLWGLIYNEGVLARMNPQTGELITTITIDQFQGQGPRDIAAGSKLLWADTPRHDVMVAIDPSTNKVVKEVQLGAYFHCDLAVLGDRLYVVPCDSGNPIQVFNEATGKPIGAIDVLSPGIPLFESDGLVWVPSLKDMTSIIPFDTATLKRADRPSVDLGVHAEWPVFDDGALWYAWGNDVYRLSKEALTR